VLKTRADLLIENGRPWSGGPIPGADTIAVAGGSILAVGRAEAIGALAGPETRRLDARGGTVTPAFSDAHIHLVAWARSRSELDLLECGSRAEALARIAAAVASRPGSAPLVGRGWDANRWSEDPDRACLDAVSGGRPVLLHSKDFHALWVNSAALGQAGVTRTTTDPQGGVLERDSRGEPTGIVREHAVRLFASVLPVEGAASDLARVREAATDLHAQGITAVHDFEGAAEHRVLRELARGDGPRLRILMHVAHPQLEHALALGLGSGTGDDHFRIGALKLFADGTLGSQTAAMLEPYEGSDGRGMDLIPPAELAAIVKRAALGGLSLAIHAIGDRAARSALDAFAQAGSALHSVALPPRIEHVQLLDPADLPRFVELGVAASLQPIHCTSDIVNARRHWGARAERSYPWRSLLERGVRLAFGSDAPVETPQTAAGLHAAVTRQRSDGSPEKGFVPAERVSLDAALGAYTEGAARLAGSWPRLGRIAPGATADLAVWNADLHRLAPGQLVGARVMATLMDGAVVFERVPEDALRAEPQAMAERGR
jgi:hypothetical protein